MTKKELLENKFFKALPDETEIMTCIKPNEDYSPLRFESLNARRSEDGKTYLVINAITFEDLEGFYCTKIK